MTSWTEQDIAAAITRLEAAGVAQNDETQKVVARTAKAPRASQRPAQKATGGRGSEHAEQAALMTMAVAHETQYPDLALLYAIPNGGARHPATAGRLKAEGVKAGVPDLCMPVARGHYISMYIEMKYGPNKLSNAQQAWVTALRGAGHHVVVCYSAEDALQALITYLELDMWTKER